jgi:HPt (histidine-containing phosphotransfer) domain-containing protein
MKADPRSIRQIAAKDLSSLAIDTDRFDRLMAMAGPAHGQELLQRLGADLESVQDRLQAALAPPDWADLRAQTHILVALAGAVGAVRLQHMASALNAAAQDADANRLPRMSGPLLDDLEVLIGFVADRRSGSDGCRVRAPFC